MYRTSSLKWLGKEATIARIEENLLLPCNPGNLLKYTWSVSGRPAILPQEYRTTRHAARDALRRGGRHWRRYAAILIGRWLRLVVTGAGRRLFPVSDNTCEAD